MKVVAVAALLSMAGAVSPSFEVYEEKFGKSYDTPEQEAQAKKCWQRNVNDIQARMATSKAKFDENKFTDMCPEEFAATFLTLDQSNGVCTTSNIPDYDKHGDTSKSIDWRDHGYVNPVKDQAKCGSCWAFSSVATMEAAHFKATNKLVSLSEQTLVSCDPTNNGCNGGMPGEAFDFIVHFGGIPLEDDYPYTSGGGDSGTCNEGKVAKKGAWFSSWRYIPSHSGARGEEALLAAVQNEGPISIAVGANSWHNYAGGIMTVADCPATGIGHAVVAVGFAQNGNNPYWIVRNSWTASWGENGYVRLSYGENTCSIQQCVSWMIVGGSGPAPPPTPVPPPGCGKLKKDDCLARDDCCLRSFGSGRCYDKGSPFCDKANQLI